MGYPGTKSAAGPAKQPKGLPMSACNCTETQDIPRKYNGDTWSSFKNALRHIHMSFNYRNFKIQTVLLFSAMAVCFWESVPSPFARRPVTVAQFTHHDACDAWPDLWISISKGGVPFVSPFVGTTCGGSVLIYIYIYTVYIYILYIYIYVDIAIYTLAIHIIYNWILLATYKIY